MTLAVAVDPKHESKIDPKLGRPKRFRNEFGQWVTKDKDGKEVVVTPLHDVDDEVTLTGRIISVSEDSEGYELVDVAVHALVHSTVPTLQFQVVKAESETVTIVVPGAQVREREAKEAKEKEEKLAKEKAEAEKKAQEEARKIATQK